MRLKDTTQKNLSIHHVDAAIATFRNISTLHTKAIHALLNLDEEESEKKRNEISLPFFGHCSS